MENRINSIVLTENNELIYDISVFNPEFKLEWGSNFPQFLGKIPYIQIIDESYDIVRYYESFYSHSYTRIIFGYYTDKMKIILKF